MGSVAAVIILQDANDLTQVEFRGKDGINAQNYLTGAGIISWPPGKTTGVFSQVMHMVCHSKASARNTRFASQGFALSGRRCWSSLQ